MEEFRLRLQSSSHLQQPLIGEPNFILCLLSIQKTLAPVSLGNSPPSAQLSLPSPSGPKSLMVGSKGCSKTETQNSTTISIHLAPPGVLVASYAHFCSSNGCNRATSSSVLLNSLPRPGMGAQGGVGRHEEMGPQRYRNSGLKEETVNPNFPFAPQLSLPQETCSVLPVCISEDPVQTL